MPDRADLPRRRPRRVPDGGDARPEGAVPGRRATIVTVPAPRLLPEMLRRDPSGPPLAEDPLLLVTTGSLGPSPIAGAGEVLDAVEGALRAALPRAQAFRLEGFDLRLMSTLNDVSGMPTEGKNLIIVAAVNHVLHFRIFDGDGKMVVDTNEKCLPDQAQPIEVLRKHLESLWPPQGMTRSEKDQVVTAVTSIVDHTRLEEGGASKAAVLDWVTGRRVVFLLAHGYYDPPSAAIPPDLPPELASGLSLADGPLSALEIGQLDLGRADLVILPVCQSATGRPFPGEGVLGLQQAFHAAGARTVVAALWNVERPGHIRPDEGVHRVPEGGPERRRGPRRRPARHAGERRGLPRTAAVLGGPGRQRRPYRSARSSARPLPSARRKSTLEFV